VYVDNRLSEGLTSFETSLLVSAFDAGKYCPVFVGIANESRQPVDVDPARVWAEVGSQRLASVDPDKIAEAERKRGRWANAMANGLSSFGAGMQTQQGTVTDSNGNVSTVTLPDTAAQQRAQDRAAQQTEELRRRNEQRGSQVTASALKHNTVFADQTYAGYVYFSHIKHHDDLLVHVPIDGVDYQFPLLCGGKH